MKNFRILNIITINALLVFLMPFALFASGGGNEYYGSGYSDYDYYGSSGYSDYDYYSSGYSDYDYYGDSGYSDYDYYGSSGYSDYDYYSSGYSDYDYYGNSGYYEPTQYYNEQDYYGYYNDSGYEQDYYGYYNDYAYGQDYYGYYNDGYYNDCYSDCYDYDYDDCYYDDCNPTPPVQDNLDAICIVSDRSIEAGESVTFTADVDGGRSPFTYRWSGDASSNQRTFTTRFNQAGIYEVNLRVTDDNGRTSTDDCGTIIVEEDEEENYDFDAVCIVSDTSIEEGDTVRFTADVDGGEGPFDYDWSGDASSDERTFTARFNREGRYEVDLKVTDDNGRVARDTCSVIRVDAEDEDEDDDDRDINVVARTNPLPPANPLASVSSVYLNQVPYTGPEDVAKAIVFAVGIIAWSIAGALIIRRKMNKKEISNRILAFKEANKVGRA